MQNEWETAGGPLAVFQIEPSVNGNEYGSERRFTRSSHILLLLAASEMQESS
jgi:hypothetical protein